MPGMNLTRAEAEERAGVVSPSHYDVVLDLRGEETFSSVTTVRFTATEGSSTFIDLVATGINTIALNGVELDSSAYRDCRIELTNLKAENTLVVDALCTFMNTGEGMHRFVDPVDNEVYLYTQFEVADARRVFAVFEQPDLKATYSFTVTGPEHWTVFSNSPTPDKVVNGDGSATWAFTDTEVMSSYLTAIIAGPYVGGSGEYRAADGRVVPLGVYARASLADHLDVDEVLDTTIRGFEFFEKEYRTAYPFRKYDQIFVPEFNAGAMENCGAVTITDAYVFRSRTSDAMIEFRAITILHELAHMWFGDLVTMKWWNDLWLNESFAEFMSHLAAAENTRWSDAWQTFLASEKSWAMAEDQLASTHPIVSAVTDLDDVWANFDGITYGKGASVLKQLVAYVGRDSFMTGLASYFEKYSWSNTTLADLLAELEAASGRDLSRWSKLWLEEEGLTVASPSLTTDGDVYTSFAVTQELGNAPSLRPHRLSVGLYDLTEGGLTLRERVTTDIDGESTEITELVGAKRADLVLVNDEDLAYTKIRLDEDSLATATEHIDAFDDNLARTLVLDAAWNMVRDGLAPASDYADLALRAVRSEHHPTSLRQLLGNLTVVATTYSAPTRREQTRTKIASGLFEIAREAEPGSELQFQTTLAAAKLAVTPEQIDTVARWRAGEDLPTGFDLDTDSTWALLQALAAAGRLGENEIDEHLAADDTANGRQSAWTARSAIPTAQAKEHAFTKLVVDGDLPNLQQRGALLGFRQGEPEILVPFFTRYLEALPGVWDKQTYEIAKQIATLMFTPTIVGRDDVDVEGALSAWLTEHEDAAPALRRTITEHLDDTRRILSVQVRDAQA